MRSAVLSVLLLCGAAIGDEVPQGNPSVSAGTFSGKASFVPWSGDWWNMKDGALGIGWNGKKSYKYNPTTKQYVFNSAVAVNDLSPLAKYDKLVGNAPMSGAAKYELSVNETLGGEEWYHHIFGNLKKKLQKEKVDFSWWGHCNGWAAAACLEAEPVGSLEKEGIRFEVADLKGLLTESYYGVVSSDTGTRYEKPEKADTTSYNKAKSLLAAFGTSTPPTLTQLKTWYKKAYGVSSAPNYSLTWYKNKLKEYIGWYEETYVKAYEDIRPDVFHKILLKAIGELKSVVVFDITASEAVWNYPAFAYETKLVDKGTKPIGGVTRRVFECSTKVTYGDDGVSPSILGARTFVKSYKYELYAATTGNTLKGGKWLGDSVDDHPDFAWFPKYNPSDVNDPNNWDENTEVAVGELSKLLPQKHLAKDGKPVQLFANGVGSQSRRTATSPVTYWNPVVTGTQVTLSSNSSLMSVQTVKYFEQKVAQVEDDEGVDYVTATRDPLVLLGQGPSIAKTFPSGKHMIVAYAYDTAGKLVAVDEITIKVQ